MDVLGKYESKIINELESKGFRYKDANYIYQNKQLESEEVAIILKWLPKVYTEHYGTADILVRSLMSAKEPFDATLLIDLFENSDLNFSLKDSIALTLASAKTNEISSWMRNQLLNNEYALERCSLVWGLPAKGGFSSNLELMSFLRKIFNKYHDEVVLKFFKKYGDKVDILFLKDKIKTSDKKLAKQFQKVVEALEKKVGSDSN
jgi:hypothetical protein